MMILSTEVLLKGYSEDLRFDFRSVTLGVPMIFDGRVRRRAWWSESLYEPGREVLVRRPANPLENEIPHPVWFNEVVKNPLRINGILYPIYGVLAFRWELDGVFLGAVAPRNINSANYEALLEYIDVRMGLHNFNFEEVTC